MIMEFPDRKALDLYLSTEPYVTEEVWEKIIIEQVNVVVPATSTAALNKA